MALMVRVFATAITIVVVAFAGTAMIAFMMGGLAGAAMIAAEATAVAASPAASAGEGIAAEK
jgi:hypothetical protein